MAVRALDLNKTHRYVTKADRPSPEAEQTVFILGTLSSRDIGRIKDMATSFRMGGETAEEGVDTKIERTKMNFEAVRLALKGWENFLDAEGNAVPFKSFNRDVNATSKDVVAPDLLDRIPLDVVNELADFVLAQHTLEDADGKN